MSDVDLFDRAIASCAFRPFNEALARAIFSGWELIPYVVDGTPMGAAFMDEGDIHVTVFPEYRHRALQQERIRAFLAPLLGKHGYLMTMVARDRPKEQRFVERIGFQRVLDQGDEIHYVLHQGQVLADNRS